MVDDFEVLTLSIEELRRVFSATHGVGVAHLCLLHLLRHLVRGVLAAQDEVVYGLQAEEREEVPRERGNPSDVQIAGADAGLQHLLELRGEGEW